MRTDDLGVPGAVIAVGGDVRVPRQSSVDRRARRASTWTLAALLEVARRAQGSETR
jgi:hypothetical protein